MDYIDSPAKQRIRIQNMRLQSSYFSDVAKRIHSEMTVSEASEILRSLSMKDIPHADVKEILYALGPDMLSRMILAMLRSAKTDEDMEEIAAYTTVRHLFFGSTHD